MPLVLPRALEPERPAQARPVAVTAVLPPSEPSPAHSQVMGVPPGHVFSLPCSLSSGAEAKTVLPKKEKMKLRREQWLQSKSMPASRGSCQPRSHPMGPPVPTAARSGLLHQPHSLQGAQGDLPRPFRGGCGGQRTVEAQRGCRGDWAAQPSRSGLLQVALSPHPCGYLQSWAASLWRTALGSCCSRLLVCKNYLFLFPTVKFFVMEVTCACGVFMVQRCLWWCVKSFQALPAVKTSVCA